MRNPSEEAEGEEGYALPPLVEGGEGRRGRGRTAGKEAIVELSRLMREDGRVDQEVGAGREGGREGGRARGRARPPPR